MPGASFLAILALAGAVLGALYACTQFRPRIFERVLFYSLLGAIALPAAYILVGFFIRLMLMLLKAVLVLILALILFISLKRLLE